MSRLAERSCPVCDRRHWERAFDAAEMFGGETYQLSRCDCGLLATDDDLDTDGLARFYHYEGGADAGGRFRGPLEPVMQALRRARVAVVTDGHRAPGRALDVGCGRGAMLAALAGRGWEVYGTELDELVGATARALLGDRIRIGPFESVDLPEVPFDVVSFWHTLEHLDDPRAALERARSVLGPGGTVVVAVPNLDSWQARWTGRSWLHLDVPRHRWHFSADTLIALAAHAGLEHVRTRHFSLEYGPYGLFQSVVARAGLGHALFTRVLRPTGRRPSWQEPAVWGHLALGLPLAAAAAAAVPVEAIAAALGHGGAIVATFQNRS